MTTTDQRRRTRRWLVPVLVLAAGLIAAAVYRGTGTGGRQDGAGPLFSAAEGPLTISVTEAGTIKPSQQEIIKNEIEGRTTILYLIPEGTRVHKGDLLVELDASSLEDSKIDQEIRVQNAQASFIQSRENLAVVRSQADSDVDKAELALRFAKEDLDNYNEGEYPNALKESEARITLAREEQRRAEEKLKWSQILFKEKYLSESELQADELAVKKAALDVELAENNLTLLRDFTRKRQTAQLESDINQAEMALERTRRRASADVVQAEADLRAKESEFNRQTDKLTKLKEQIAKARITAPRDGLVVYATSTRPSWRGNTEPLAEGQEVREREELIHLPTASTFVAEVKVHESNLEKIHTGLPVRITVDALPGQEFRGKVTTIAPLPDAMSVFMNPDLKLYDTEIEIEGGGDVLRTGMSCQVEIVVERYPNALYVPIQAVVRVNGQSTVFVQTASGPEARKVKAGLDNNRMVRILSGLKAGEEVLLAPPLDTAAAPAEDSMSVATAETPPAQAADSLREPQAPPSAPQPEANDGDREATRTMRRPADGEPAPQERRPRRRPARNGEEPAPQPAEDET